jgi:asparagine synthase (glutamine-hydrolysing)
VTVALNGDGGDEAYAGYPWYVFQKIAAQIDAYPSSIRKLLLSPFAHLPRAWQNTFFRRAHIFASTHSLDSRERYLGYYTSSFFTESEKWALYTPDFASRVQGANSLSHFRKMQSGNITNDALDAAFSADIASYLPDALLTKVDLASMAHSLEVRSPFLDQKFLEFSASIPSAMKMPGYATKTLLKEALIGTIPQEILQGKKKGFMVPLDAWFRGPFASAVRETLLTPGSRLHNIIKREAIESLIDEHQRGHFNHGSRIWSLMTLSLWLEQYNPAFA